MDDTAYLISLEKRNFWIRLGILLILLVIAVAVIFFKYGYTDPDDSALFDRLGTKIISCKDALYYYAEKELKIFNESKQIVNLSSYNYSKLYP